MYFKVERTFYILASFILLALFFVAKPTGNIEVAKFQSGIIDQTNVAFTQLVSQINPLNDFELIWDGVNAFYASSTQVTIALLEMPQIPAQTQEAIDYTALAVANMLKFDFSLPKSSIAQPPVVLKDTTNLSTNLTKFYSFDLPQDGFASEISKISARLTSMVSNTPQTLAQAEPVIKGQVAGVSLVEQELIQEAEFFEQNTYLDPVNNPSLPWVTLQDNLTGAYYCVAIYNKEVNSYPGKCKYEYN